MDINNSINISSQISTSLSKLNLTTAKRAFEVQSDDKNSSEVELQSVKKSDIELIDDKIINKKAQKNNNAIDVQEIQKYASYMGENLSIDDINYGLMYGRSVIADFIA